MFGAPVFTGAVGSFTDANPAAPVSDFRATIDWGDGTPDSVGTVSQPGGPGTAFIVTGSHTYADAGVNGGVGTFPITVYVDDVGGSKLTVVEHRERGRHPDRPDRRARPDQRQRPVALRRGHQRQPAEVPGHVRAVLARHPVGPADGGRRASP